MPSTEPGDRKRLSARAVKNIETIIKNTDTGEGLDKLKDLLWKELNREEE